MIVKPIDLAIVQRMNDVSQIKQQENDKPMLDQQNITAQIQKEVTVKSEQVTKKENADNGEKKFDAKDKSENEYFDNHAKNKNKKEKEDGRVFLKGAKTMNFDVKI